MPGQGRATFKALVAKYEGTGIMAISLQKAENTIQTLFYSGEKRPHMWWDKFVTELNAAYTAKDRHKGRQCYTNAEKLKHMVYRRLQADITSDLKTNFEVKLGEVPMTLTYDSAIWILTSEN